MATLRDRKSRSFTRESLSTLFSRKKNSHSPPKSPKMTDEDANQAEKPSIPKRSIQLDEASKRMIMNTRNLNQFETLSRADVVKRRQTLSLNETVVKEEKRSSKIGGMFDFIKRGTLREGRRQSVSIHPDKFEPVAVESPVEKVAELSSPESSMSASSADNADSPRSINSSVSSNTSAVQISPSKSNEHTPKKYSFASLRGTRSSDVVGSGGRHMRKSSSIQKGTERVLKPSLPPKKLSIDKIVFERTDCIKEPKREVVPKKKEEVPHNVDGLNEFLVSKILSQLFSMKDSYKGMQLEELQKNLEGIYGVMAEGKYYQRENVLKMQKCVRDFLWRRRVKRKWFNTSYEVLESERTYVKHLELATILFHEPLLTRDFRLIGISQVDGAPIFGNLSEILKVHRNFLRKLEENFVRDGVPLNIGELIVQHMEECEDAYKLHISTCQLAADTLKRMMRKPKFEQWLTSIQMGESQRLNQLKLEDLLHTPIKRIPLYLLLLKAAVKTIPIGNPEYEKCQLAIEKVENLADQLNRTKRGSDNISKMHAIANGLKSSKHHGNFPKLEDLAAAKRDFIFEGPIFYVSKSSKLLTGYLFNDLLILEYNGTLAHIIRLSRSLQVKNYKDNEFMSHRFCIEQNRDSPFIFACPTARGKEAWVASFASLATGSSPTPTRQRQSLAIRSFSNVTLPEFMPKPIVGNVTKTGVLNKSRGMVNSKRFCFIEDEVFYYSSSSRNSNHSNQREYGSTSPPPKAIQLGRYFVFQDAQKPLGFKLVSDSDASTFHFQAGDKEEYDAWMTALDVLANRNSINSNLEKN